MFKDEARVGRIGVLAKTVFAVWLSFGGKMMNEAAKDQAFIVQAFTLATGALILVFLFGVLMLSGLTSNGRVEATIDANSVESPRYLRATPNQKASPKAGQKIQRKIRL